MKKKAVNLKFKSPIPTRIISNGEFDPISQSIQQIELEKIIQDESFTISKKLGISRREFLHSSSSIILGLVALNKVFGNFFDVSASEIKNPILYPNQKIIDIQTHLIMDNFHNKNLERFASWSMKHNFIDPNSKINATMERFKLANYLKEIFIDSDTSLAFLSGAPFDNSETVTNQQISETVKMVNEKFNQQLMQGYYVVNPLEPNYLDRIKNDIKNGIKPIGWKLFPMGEPMSAVGKPWRLDDEKLIFPFYDYIQKIGITNICIHKGLIPNDYELKYPMHYLAGKVDDLKQAAIIWPKINFIIFHAALKSFNNKDQNKLLNHFYSNDQIDWSTDLINLIENSKLENVYAELGTSFASCAITNPEFCAAFLGQLINRIGAEKIIWGTDSVWYGSPQWQIQAFRKFQIPKTMMIKKNWKHNLTDEYRDQIFYRNSVKMFNLDDKLITPTGEKLKNHDLSTLKITSRSNDYYGHYES